MSRYIVKHDVDGKPRYLVWSTIVDAPITYGVSRGDLNRWWIDEYKSVAGFDSTIANARTVADVIACNRAGAGETELTAEQLVDWYFVRQGHGERPRGDRKPLDVADHAYLSAGDNPYASGDVAHRGCSICGRPRGEHP